MTDSEGFEQEQPTDANDKIDVGQIIITGCYDTGKTQFIETACRGLACMEQITHQIKGEYFSWCGERCVLEKNLALDFYEIHSLGSHCLEIMPLLPNLLGVIFLFDSSCVHEWRCNEAMRSMLGSLIFYRYYTRAPALVIAANKQDHPDSWSVEDWKILFRSFLKHEDDETKITPLVPCVATEWASVKNVLLTLLKETQNYCDGY